MKVKIRFYDGSKYTNGKKVAEAEYKIKSFKVVEMTDSEVYELGFDEVDPAGEYLILETENGETSTMRNSFCDMFRV